MNPTRRNTMTLLLVVLAPYLALGVLNIYLGRLTADEGWYALAARNVWAGKLPYRDFLFTQTPLLPYVYGAWLEILDGGVLAGRWLSLAFGAGAVAAVTLGARRVAGLRGGAIAGALLAFNLSVVFDTSALKTQSLTVLLTALGLLALTGPRPRSAWSVAAFTASVGCRLAMLPALGLLWLWLLWRPPEGKGRVWSGSLVVASAVTLATGAAVFWADGNLLFGVLHFHSVYFGEIPWTAGGFFRFAEGVLLNQGLITAAAIVALGILGVRAVRGQPPGGLHAVAAFAGLAWLATTVLHASRPVAYPTYQTSNVALAALLVAVPAGRLLGAAPRRIPALLVFVVLLLAGMPAQEYELRPDGDATVGRLAEAAAVVREVAPEARTALTFQSALVVEAGLDVLPGYELGQFSYFADLSAEEAARRRVVTTEAVLADIRSRRADLLLLTQRDVVVILAGGDLRKLDILKRFLSVHYTAQAEIQGYGQFSDTLMVFTPR